jgi:hypothetical protein
MKFGIIVALPLLRSNAKQTFEAWTISAFAQGQFVFAAQRRILRLRPYNNVNIRRAIFNRQQNQ